MNHDYSRFRSERFRAWRQAFGQRLRKTRTLLGESQKAFGLRIGVTKLTVMNYEAGKTVPTCEVLPYLGELGIDAAYLAFGVPSLSNQKQIAAFSEILSYVKERLGNDFGKLSMPAHSIREMDIAWDTFCRLTALTDGRSLDTRSIDLMFQEALVAHNTIDDSDYEKRARECTWPDPEPNENSPS